MFIGSDKWQLRYQRNNKQSGLKNLRCFPACSDPHRLRGFCGNSVSFQLPSNNVHFTLSFGEFAQKDTPSIKVGQVITEADIIENERLEDLFKPWHRGEPQEDGLIVFNKQKKGWHYSWVSNKHTSDSEHVFRVYLFEDAGIPRSYRCVATYDSPAFTIFCRRRDKSGVDNLPPQFLNALQTKNLSGSDAESDSESEDVDSAPKGRKGAKQSARKPARSSRGAAAVASTPSNFHDLAGNKKARLSPVLPAAASALSQQPTAFFAPPPTHLVPSSVAGMPTSLATEFAVVFRLLAALTNVHDRQIQNSTGIATSSSNLPSSSVADSTSIGILNSAGVMRTSSSASSSAPPSVIIKGNPATPSTIGESDDPDVDLFDISKAINECWDWIGNDGVNDTQFLDTFFSQPSARPLEDMLLRLGQHLLKEDFFREIEEVFANRASGGDESKRQVLRCLKDKFERFFAREGTTLEGFDYDLVSQNPQLAVEKTGAMQLFFSNQGGRIAYHNPLPAMDTLFRSPFRIVPGGPHDFTGHWRRPASTLETLEKLRSIIGFSWIERKLLLQMEQEFLIYYEGNTMFVRGQRKLAGSNTLVHIIDGRDYPFVLPQAMLGDNTPALGLFNRTWTSDDGINFCTTYTPEYRTIRRSKRSSCGNKLESIISLERNESCQLPGVWVEVLAFPVVAERVTSY